MRDEKIDALIQRLANDAEHDIEDKREIYDALLALKTERDAAIALFKWHLSDADMRDKYKRW